MFMTLKRNRDFRLAHILVGVACAMLALSYAAVPLYRLFCQVTGIEGTVSRANAAPGQILARQMKVSFDANVNRGFPWTFHTVQISQQGHIGEVMLAKYYAKNLSDHAVTGRAIFNVQPNEAGKYFHKIQCFCFNNQTLRPGEAVEMPVTYFIDPAIARDRRLDGMTEITLSYTFYDPQH